MDRVSEKTQNRINNYLNENFNENSDKIKFISNVIKYDKWCYSIYIFSNKRGE